MRRGIRGARCMMREMWDVRGKNRCGSVGLRVPNASGQCSQESRAARRSREHALKERSGDWGRRTDRKAAQLKPLVACHVRPYEARVARMPDAEELLKYILQARRKLRRAGGQQILQLVRGIQCALDANEVNFDDAF